NVGDTLRVQLTLGALAVQNGTTFTLNRVRFELDCTNTSTGSVPCTDDGLVIGYNGDATISTTCAGVTWTSGHATSGSPNEVVFDASPDIVIPAGSANFCQLEFDVTVLGASNDATPNTAEETAGYNASQSDGACDNGLASSGAQSGSIPLCPPCNDNNNCTTESCNADSGQCQTTSTVTCHDNNACTTESCNTATGQCQTTSTTTCNDSNACTTESCNTATGQCQTTSTTTCNDSNACTTESCNTSTGQCQTTSTTTCNDSNGCTT